MLFDPGSGPDFMPSASVIDQSLDAAGLGTGDITHVLMTHAPPDNIWGIIDEFNEPAFYNASHFIGAREHEYWSDPATSDFIGADRRRFAADQDAVTGIATRMALLEELSVSGENVVGFHLPDGVIGTIASGPDGYDFSPA